MEESHLTESSLGAFNENEQGTSKVSQEGEVDTNVVPEVGMHFDTHEAARQFYDQYAKHKGFFTKIKRSWKSKDGDDLSAIIYTCYKAGSKNINRGTLSDRGTSLSDCKALMKVKRMETKWRITEIILDHNHELTSSNLWLPRPRRRKNSGVKKKLKKRLIVDQRPSTRRHMIISSNETETLPNAQPGTFSRETGDSMWTPADIKELTNSYIYIVDMPGLKSEDIKVQIENSNVLIVGGERKRNESEDPESKYIKRERVKKFMRKFILPADANMDAISAICRDSVLTVAVAKTPPEPKRPKIFEVKVG